MRLGAKVNLVVCQKSKIEDWVQHFDGYYEKVIVYDLTNKAQFECFFGSYQVQQIDINNVILIGVINYELVFRRNELSRLRDFSLMLDESSLIQNENSKRAKFILKKLKIVHGCLPPEAQSADV